MEVIYNERLCYDGNYNDDKYYKQKKEDDYVREKYKCDLNIVKESGYLNKTVDLELDSCKNEKALNVEIGKKDFLRVYGTVIDSKGEAAKEKRVTLFKSILFNYKTEYIPICDMVTDENGVYETILDNLNPEDHYMVKVSD